jgi:hypothetical protein
MRELELLQRGAAAASIIPATAPALDAENAPDNEETLAGGRQHASRRGERTLIFGRYT